jgi:hypothetical protein
VASSCVLPRCSLTGQIDGIALALEILALLSAVGRRPVALGGLSVAVALLKPQVLWLAPVTLLIALTRRRQRRRFAIGGLTAVLLLVGLPAVVYPGRSQGSAHSLAGLVSSIQTVQLDLAGLPGLLRFAPTGWGFEPSLTSPITLLRVSVGIASVGWLVWRTGHASRWTELSPLNWLMWAVVLQMGVWFLVSP